MTRWLGKWCAVTDENATSSSAAPPSIVNNTDAPMGSRSMPVAVSAQSTSSLSSSCRCASEFVTTSATPSGRSTRRSSAIARRRSGTWYSMCIASVTSNESSANGSDWASVTNKVPSPWCARALRSIPSDRSAPHTMTAVAAPAQRAQVHAVAATDVEDRLVTLQRGERRATRPTGRRAVAGRRRSTGAPRGSCRRSTAFP